MAKSEIFNTGYFSISTENEHLFLSVTPACKHGPGIKRDGVTLPRMKDPHAIPEVTIAGIGKILDSKIQESLEDTTNAFEQRAGTWTIYHHLKEFIQAKGNEWRVIGLQGSGDLTMNPWHIAFIGSNSYQKELQNTVCGMLVNDEWREPIERRVYRCLVKWNEQVANKIGRQYEFLNLKFTNLDTPKIIQIADQDIASQREKELASIDVIEFNPDLRTIAPYIEFALAGKTIIEKAHQLPLVAAIDQFQDVRHIFSIPHKIKCSGGFRGQIIEQINLGEYQLYENLNVRRAALNGPIIIDTRFDEAGAFFTFDINQLQEDLEHQNFKMVSKSPREVGEYFLHNDKTIEIYFPRNVYPFGILGMQENKLFCFSSSGLSGRIGNTLEGINRIMIDNFSCEEAMVLDEGLDVFQIVNPIVDNNHGVSFQYTNDDLLKKVLKFTYEQIQTENKQSTKGQVNADHLGGKMKDWPLNENLWETIVKDWGAKDISNLDYSDIFPVKPTRSQIRSVLIFAVRNS